MHVQTHFVPLYQDSRLNSCRKMITLLLHHKKILERRKEASRKRQHRIRQSEDSIKKELLALAAYLRNHETEIPLVKEKVFPVFGEEWWKNFSTVWIRDRLL